MQGVLGYVILRPLMTAVGFVASLIGVYGDGELRFDRVYLYTTIVSNISQVGLCIKLHQLVTLWLQVGIMEETCSHSICHWPFCGVLASRTAMRPEVFHEDTYACMAQPKRASQTCEAAVSRLGAVKTVPLPRVSPQTVIRLITVKAVPQMSGAVSAGMGAVLPGAVLPGHQVRAGAHQAGVQVPVCQGSGLPHVLARSGHRNTVMERSVADRGMLLLLLTACPSPLPGMMPACPRNLAH